MPRLTRFGFYPQQTRPRSSRVSIFEPTFGFDGGQAPQELGPGFTPSSENWEYDGGYITPRSALSVYPGNILGDAGLFGIEAFDVSGFRHGVIASAGTLAFLLPEADSWSSLSYVAAAGASGEAPAGEIGAAWDGAYLYDISRDKNIAVLTNNDQLPKFLEVEPSTTTFSDFTWAISSFSQARAIAAIDNRLVWFNTSSALSSFPTRVQWSARGAPTDYTSSDANFEDLLDMRGTGVRIVPEGDNMVLFSTEEIWRGRKRLDVYAFDFYAVNRQLGAPYPRTIAATPYGPAFLGGDLEVYLLRGDELAPLGASSAGHSRIQSYLRRNIVNARLAWGVYNSAKRAYHLYFPTGSDLYPMRAFYYSFENNSWFEQSFSHALSAGFEMRDVAEATTWDSISASWDEYNVPWDAAGLDLADRRIVVLSSAGTQYNLHSTATNDDGSSISARWRSHALTNPYLALNYSTLFEVRVEADVPSASSATIRVSTDGGATFDTGYGIAFSASSHTVALAPVFGTSQAPVFELTLADGSRPRVSRLQASLRDAGTYGGGR